jgi:hypothetical protein
MASNFYLEPGHSSTGLRLYYFRCQFTRLTSIIACVAPYRREEDGLKIIEKFKELSSREGDERDLFFQESLELLSQTFVGVDQGWLTRTAAYLKRYGESVPISLRYPYEKIMLEVELQLGNIQAITGLELMELALQYALKGSSIAALDLLSSLKEKTNQLNARPWLEEKGQHIRLLAKRVLEMAKAGHSLAIEIVHSLQIFSSKEVKELFSLQEEERLHLILLGCAKGGMRSLDALVHFIDEKKGTGEKLDITELFWIQRLGSLCSHFAAMVGEPFYCASEGKLLSSMQVSSEEDKMVITYRAASWHLRAVRHGKPAPDLSVRYLFDSYFRRYLPEAFYLSNMSSLLEIKDSESIYSQALAIVLLGNRCHISSEDKQSQELILRLYNEMNMTHLQVNHPREGGENMDWRMQLMAEIKRLIIKDKE